MDGAAVEGGAAAPEAEDGSLLGRLGADRPGLPVCLITGFLGSGKTTLVNHILANSQGCQAAVFVNEFGSVDVDGALIRSQIDEDRVVSLTNGCVCCEVNEDLARQLTLLLRARRESIDVVIIETSGVCDPDPVVTTLQQIEDVDRVHLDTVVCVVDAETVWDADFGGSADAKRQLSHADIVLLNKVDRLADTQVEEAEGTLQSYLRAQDLRPEILRTVRAEVDVAALCGLSQRSGRPAPKRKRLTETPEHRHSPAHFESFAYRSSSPFDAVAFETWAECPPAGLLRAKGLLWVRGVPKYVCFHLAGRRTNPFETLPGREPPVGSEIVFIAKKGTVNVEGLTKALDGCLC